MIEVSEKLKKAFMTDNVEKHIRITFPNGEHEDITNDKIVANTFKFEEPLCSQSVLKFGICESKSINVIAECANIKGCEINVFIDAFYEGEVYPIQLGVFTVDSCKRQSGTNLRNIEAYTEVISDTYSITDLEKQKRALLVPTSAMYKVDLFKTLISSGLIDAEKYIDKIETVEDKVNTETVFFKNQLYKPNPYDSDVYRVSLLIDNIRSGLQIDATNKENLYQFDYTIDDNFNYEETANQITNDCINNLKKWKSSYKVPDFIEYDEVYNAVLEALKNNNYGLLRHIPVKNGIQYLHNQYIKFLKNDIYYPNLGDISYYDSSDYIYEIITAPAKIISIFMTIEDYNKQVTITKYENRFLTAVTDSYIKKISLKNVFNYSITAKRVVYNTEAENKFYYAIPEDINIKYLSAFCEINGLFAKSGREYKLDLISINDYFAYYPKNELFPDSTEYPSDGSNNYQPLSTVSYKEADYEEFSTHKYGYVRVTYLASDNEKYSITVECDPTKDNVYEMKNNEIFLDRKWTANEVKNTILTYFYPNVKDISYQPANLQIKGLPFIEAGDIIEVNADNGVFKTFVFRRTLTGEQLLVDQIEASGVERHEKADEWIAVAGQIIKE